MRTRHAARALTLGAAALIVPAPDGAAPPGPSPRPGKLLAVFAHPDDETIVSPILASYARRGVQAQLVIATDGGKGVTPHAGIPAGEALARVRAGEARCSAGALGIQSPTLIGMEDAGLSVIQPWPGERLDRLAGVIGTAIAEADPDVVLTWGPEGAYGHPDHRLVGDVVTQLFQAGGDNERRRLYFVGFTADRIAAAPRWFGFRMYPTSPRFLTTCIPFTDEDVAVARKALSCHRSQATKEQMDESLAALVHLWNGRVCFQQWRGGPESSDLFATP
jgi:LmbE family N-acetylglucosaminyl deacetylase